MEIAQEPWKLPAAKRSPVPDFSEPAGAGAQDCEMMMEIGRKKERKLKKKM